MTVTVMAFGVRSSSLAGVAWEASVTPLGSPETPSSAGNPCNFSLTSPPRRQCVLWLVVTRYWRPYGWHRGARTLPALVAIWRL